MSESAPTSGQSVRRPPGNALAYIASCVLVLAVGFGLRTCTSVCSLGPTFDEPWIIQPIFDLIERGWSVETAIDFEETKGPGLIWPYAIVGQWLGGSLNNLRLLSVIFFVLGVVPLLDLARRGGGGASTLLLVGTLYALLPYHAPLSQLVMSEPSFVALSLAACWVAVVGISASKRGMHRRSHLLLPVIFTVLLAILLHNRVHAVATAGAVTLAAVQTLGWRRSLPWIIACVIAGISRVPLWVRWGGLVSPRWQQAMDLGVNLAPAIYLLAALAPVLTVFALVVLSDVRLRKAWPMLALACAMGAGLVMLVRPDLSAVTSMADQDMKHFSGMVATAARIVSASAVGQMVCVSIAAGCAAAGLYSLWLLMAMHAPSNGLQTLTLRLQCWLISIGLALYGLVSAPAFDRYVLGWIVLLPLAWVWLLPRWAIAIQGTALTGIAAWLCSRWLI